jgi:uncharacterized protein (TIGR00269 family)
MIGYGERIAVGVSGGKDSLTLLSVLKKILKKSNCNDIIAITIDEGIEEYRDESIHIVENHCKKTEIPFKIFSYKELFGTSMDEAMLKRPSKKISSCSICGTFRRRAIDMAAKSVGADIVATAHNLDDHIQTFMINLFSGDVDRIGLMHPTPTPLEYDNGLKKIKPFLELYENEIVFYAFNSGIEFQAEECPYMNESIRSDFRKFFNELEKLHPGIKYNCYSSVNKLSRMVRDSCLQNSSSHLKKTCLKCGNITNNEVCSVCKTIFLLETK